MYLYICFNISDGTGLSQIVNWYNAWLVQWSIKKQTKKEKEQA
jgi:hypothetical protein